VKYILRLKDSEKLYDQVALKAKHWETHATELEQGISLEIDQRMEEWRLSEAEREVGMLILKGLSMLEIAKVRGTSDRTVRHQALAVYSKAGVTGRAELAAFFLEDFLDRGAKRKSVLTVNPYANEPR
jgi:DNA-binding NarL/FixJ family response regulator